MNILAAPAAATAAAHIATPALGAPTPAEAILQTAHLLLTSLERGRPISTNVLGSAMSSCFGGTDAEGCWIWKDAYEALEAAQVLFIRKFGAAILSRSVSSEAALAMLTKVAQLVPTHTRRSQESQAMQQLSTPLPLAFVVAQAAAIASSDLVLEPSAGTGLLGVFAEIARASLTLNELAATRADLLDVLFPGAARSRHDAAHIDDHLDAGVKPSVV
ncbi:MAG: methylase, partial [Mesorhizobium sp.]